jgi:hypothetical protein
VYQFSSSKEGNQLRVFPLSLGQLDACKSTMVPTSMVVPGVKWQPLKSAKQSKAATMVAEITKTYAKRNKAPSVTNK